MNGDEKRLSGGTAICRPPELARGHVVEPRAGRQMIKVHDPEGDYHGEVVPANPPCDDARPGDQVAFSLILVGTPPGTLMAIGVYLASRHG